MAEEQKRVRDTPSISFTWWSWRPGIRPALALLIGAPLTMLGLLLLSLGLLTLVGGILDSVAPPLQIRGDITAHSSSNAGHFYYLRIHLLPTPAQAADFPATLSLSVSPSVFQKFHDGQSILVDYAPHLLSPYALSSLKRPHYAYPLPNRSAAGNPVGALALLLIGVVLLPYPALLTHWGWRDLIASISGFGAQHRRAVVIERRCHVPNPLARRPAQPGLMRASTRPSYGIAVQFIEEAAPTVIVTFRVDEKHYAYLHEGAQVRVAYSPHLHYLYGVELEPLP